MSTSSRIIAVVGTIVVLVIAFVLLSPDDEKKPAATSTPNPTAPPSTTATATTTPKPAPPPEPTYTAIVVRDGKPLGGVQRIKVAKGERVRIEVSSPDTADEIHIHGYDLEKNLEAGRRVRFAFVADADGIYEIELERAGVQLAKLVVQPR